MCCATERVIVEADIHDDFVAALDMRDEAAVLGDPFDAATTLGPLNNEPTAAKMDRHMADALERGATVALAVGRASGYPTSLYYEFTVLDGVTEEMLVAREESFGPVVPVLSVPTKTNAPHRQRRSPRLAGRGLHVVAVVGVPGLGVVALRVGDRERLDRLLRERDAVRGRGGHANRLGTSRRPVATRRHDRHPLHDYLLVSVRRPAVALVVTFVANGLTSHALFARLPNVDARSTSPTRAWVSRCSGWPWAR